ncbi:MAG: (d)CMP kinase [Clostridia bacterium]|nr:(d)CMP kinase [Clostridia bacterium]
MISIALDGPAGAGKSTLAKAAAKKLGYIYVDTGALYRAVGLKFSRLGFDTELKCEIEPILKTTAVDIRFIGEEQHVFLDGEDVNALIRTPEISMMASAVSAKPPVRAFLLELQRKLARENNVIMDGRDIGTVVLPDATLKLFVTATPETRANRRFKELTEKGMRVNYDDILSDIKTRDYNDTHRDVAPLKVAEGGIVFDTDELPFDKALEALMQIIDKEVKK